LANEVGLHIHIDNVLLRPGGGDPLGLIELAVKQLRRRTGQRGGYFAKAVLLDSDTLGRSQDRDERARKLARDHDLELIWQRPCHEGFLLRHLEGCEALRPATAEQAGSSLELRWPDFYKAMPANRLQLRIDAASVQRAAKVENQLGAFLERIGFIGFIGT
jgi:hypothetical protein